MNTMSTIEYTTRQCAICWERDTLSLPSDGFNRWRKGELVQDAFPDLSVDVREQLISGTHPACWGELMGEE